MIFVVVWIMKIRRRGSRDMKIATIGTGFIVERYLDAVRKGEGAECYGVYSRTEGKARLLADEFQIGMTITAMDGMIADGNYDGVYGASPNSLHYDYAQRALEVGQHVICETRFTSTLRLLEELIALRKKQGLFVFEAFTPIHLPHFKVVRENLGRIGVLKVVQSN